MEQITIENKPQTTLDEEVAIKSYKGPLVIVTILFFMWGFITCMNDILIPKLQQVFVLQNWQAMLIQTAFFGAYFFISLGYYLISVTKGDPISKIGYKKGIISGLIVAAIGCFLFFPAASIESYVFFLLALFVLASGITILQIAANPYVAVLGPPKGASSRLNMTQAFNSLGTTIAPIIGGYFIFEVSEAATVGAESVKAPYLGLALSLIVIALVFRMVRLPKITESGNAISGGGALRYPHLALGIFCIFAYVGGEVAVGSVLINFVGLPNIAGLKEAEASHFLAFFWGGAMIGRFFGAVALADFKNNLYRFGIIGLITIVTFFTVYGIYGLDLALITLALVLVNIAVLLLGRFIPNRTLGLFALSVIILLLFGIFGEGHLAMWAIIAIGIFNSIMFPTIFALAIEGLGKYTGQASSLLVMAIVGGAIVPPLQGLFADISGSLQLSFIVPMICYLYIAFYGFIGYKVNRSKA